MPKPSRRPNLHICRTHRDLKRLLQDSSLVVSYDIETNGLNPFAKGSKINTLGVGTEATDYVIPVALRDGNVGFSRDDVEDFAEDLLDWMTEPDRVVVMQNGKFDILWTWVKFGVRLPCHFDTMLAHYALDENTSHALKSSKKGGEGLTQRFLGVADWDVDKKTKTGAAGLQALANYQAPDLCYTRELYSVFMPMLEKEPAAKKIFDEILMPVSRIFMEAQYDGVVIDMAKFDDAEAYLREQVAKAEEELNGFARINWRSTKELGELLFGKFKIKPPLKTPKGKPSTSESALNMIDHPCVSALLKLRAANQQLSFFIEGWKPHLHQTRTACYLHPSFKLTGTVTGRPSCENPNLFQVPRDKRIRSLITAEEGWTLVECDLSQIEMRLAAEVSKDPNLLYAFTHGIDVHWLTAMREIERGHGLVELVMATAKQLEHGKMSYADAIQVLVEACPDKCCAINEEWKEYRKKAKAVNFGYLYGMWWKKFKQYARDNYGVEMTDAQAEASRKAYFENYPSLAPWHARQKSFVARNGYVWSLSGRKRRLPNAMLGDATREDEMKSSQAKRQAINSPIQSFANEINFMSAIQLRKEYGRDKVKIIGTVYDAILMRVRNDYVDEVTGRLLEIMRRPALFDSFGIKLTVPIEGEAKVGPWGAGTEYHKWREQNDVRGSKKANGKRTYRQQA